MRIDLPQCGFKLCRKSFDGNCIGSETDRKECENFALEHQQANPTGAINFLRKAKAIYSRCEMKCCDGRECPIQDICNDSKHYNLHDMNEADLVTKVMAYKIEEETNAEN